MNWLAGKLSRGAGEDPHKVYEGVIEMLQHVTSRDVSRNLNDLTLM